MGKLERSFPFVLILVGVVVSAYSINVSADRTLTPLENTLLQVIILVASLIGSFWFGRQSATSAAREIIKPHARSAFRRLISLYQSLSRVATEISSYRGDSKNVDADVLLARLDAIVTEQLATADGSLEDWRDIVPDEVEELKSRITISTDREIDNG